MSFDLLPNVRVHYPPNHSPSLNLVLGNRLGVDSGEIAAAGKRCRKATTCSNYQRERALQVLSRS
jgi:hypothetical protein